jgi:hypothetical protein
MRGFVTSTRIRQGKDGTAFTSVVYVHQGNSVIAAVFNKTELFTGQGVHRSV